MSGEGAVAVWSTWRLHADAVAEALVDEGVPAVPVEEPVTVTGLLVAGAVDPNGTELLESRRLAGRSTIVWGGTLPPPRVAILRASGAAAYLSSLAPPAEVARVVRLVRAGEDPPWPDAPLPMSSLTPREREVAVAYLVTGADLTRARVAQEMGISERTLKVHVANIRNKTGHEGTAAREGLRQALAFRGWLD